MNLQTRNKFIQLAAELSIDDFDDALEIVRTARTFLASRQTRNLKIGDNVYFDGNSRGIIHGVVSKINTKTIKVKTSDTVWLVAKSFIRTTVS
jgi:SpoU rRNA methylase family enzyme